MDMKNPPVVILAAGANTRFFPLNTQVHKGGLILGGQPLINQTLSNLAQHHFQEVMIIVSPTDQELRQRVGQLDLGLDVSFIEQPQPTGMGDALLQVADQLPERFCVIRPELTIAGDLLSQMVTTESDLVLCGIETSQPWLYGVFKLDEAGRAVGLVEKPQPGLEPSTTKIEAVYVLGSTFLKQLRQEQDHEYSFESALNYLLSHQPQPLIRLSQEFPSLKYPWHLFDFLGWQFSQLTSFRGQNITIADSAVLDETNGPIHIGHSVTISHAAKLVGPCFVGDNVLIGDYSFVRASSIEARATIGANTEVVRSIVMTDSTIHFGYLADSIVGERVQIAAGLITANKRHDRASIVVPVKRTKVDLNREAFGTIVGHDTKLGVRTTTMPGVFIGSQVTTHPSLTLFKHVAHHQVVTTDSPETKLVS